MNVLIRRGTKAYARAAVIMPDALNVVTLFDGVLRHLCEARMAYESSHFASSLQKLDKAASILMGLRRNLKRDVAPELFDKLDAFYASYIFRITNLTKYRFDDAFFKVILSGIRDVRNAWADVAGMDAIPGPEAE